MRVILFIILCVSLLGLPAFARELCPPCFTTLEPLAGRGIAPDGSGRRKILVYIDSSWDVSPGNTNPSIWNGVNRAVSMWNAQGTCYYFDIDQDNGRTGKDIVIIYEHSSVIRFGCADWTALSPHRIRLTERIPPLTDNQIGATVAHEMGHAIGSTLGDGHMMCFY